MPYNPEYYRAWREKNRASIADRRRKWRAANRDKGLTSAGNPRAARPGEGLSKREKKRMAYLRTSDAKREKDRATSHANIAKGLRWDGKPRKRPAVRNPATDKQTLYAATLGLSRQKFFDIRRTLYEQTLRDGGDLYELYKANNVLSEREKHRGRVDTSRFKVLQKDID